MPVPLGLVLIVIPGPELGGGDELMLLRVVTCASVPRDVGRCNVGVEADVGIAIGTIPAEARARALGDASPCEFECACPRWYTVGLVGCGVGGTEGEGIASTDERRWTYIPSCILLFPLAAELPAFEPDFRRTS